MKKYILLLLLFPTLAFAGLNQITVDGIQSVLNSKELSDFSETHSLNFWGIEKQQTMTFDANRYYLVKFALSHTNCHLIVLVSGMSGQGDVRLQDSNCIQRNGMNEKIQTRIKNECQNILADSYPMNPETDLEKRAEELKVKLMKYQQCLKSVSDEVHASKNLNR